MKKKQKNTTITDPYKEIVEELRAQKDIPIYKWNQACWKCRKETSVVSYDFNAGYSFSIGDILKLDETLMLNYPFVKKVFSKTMEKEVIANTCIHCGALQGNWYVRDSLIDIMSPENVNLDKLTDRRLHNNLEFEDLSIDRKDLEPSTQQAPA